MPDIDRWIEFYYRTERDDIRLRIACTIAQYDPPAPVSVLLDIVDRYEGKGEGIAALRKIIKLGDKTLLNALIERMDQVVDGARAEICFAIGQMGDESHIPLLSRYLTDEYFQVRQCAVIALGRIGGPLALEALSEREKQLSEDNINVRIAFNSVLKTLKASDKNYETSD